MSYGFQVLNAAGELIVSDALLGQHFLGRAELQESGTRNGLAPWQRWRISGHAGQPVLPFLRTSGGWVAVDCVASAGGALWDIYTIGTASEVLCFSGLPSVPPTDAYGVQVLQPGGAVSFDSSRKPLNIRWATDVAPGQTATGMAGVSYSVPSLSQPAWFCPTAGVRRTYTWGTLSDAYVEAVLTARVSGTTLSFATPSIYTQIINHSYEPEPAAPDVYEDEFAPGFIAVIDGAHY